MIELKRRIEIIKTEICKNKKERDFLNHCKNLLKNIEEVFSRNNKKAVALILFLMNSWRVNENEIPRNIFRYDSFKNAVRSIEGKYIHFSSIEKFNDPFEGTVPLEFNSTSDEKILKFLKLHRDNNNGKDITKGKYKNISKNRRECFEIILNSVQNNVNASGVFCCSEKDDLITMWSHYAESHTGVCLEYDILEDSSAFSYVEKVNYQSEFPSNFDISDAFPKRVEKKNTNSLLNISLLTKSDVWEKEKEIRVVKQFETGETPVKTDSLKSIAFGLKCSEENKNNIIKLLKENNYNHDLLIKKAVKKKGFYELEIKTLGLLSDF